MRSRFLPSLQSLHATVSRGGVVLMRIERRFRGSSATALADLRLNDDGDAGTDFHERLTAALRSVLQSAECRRTRMHVVLADELTRYFMVTPPANAGSLRDCRAAAQMRFQVLYGEAATEWRIEADWDARTPFLACAVPMNLQRSLQTVLAERQIVPAGLVPQFVSAWNRWQSKLRNDAWFGVASDSGMTVGAIHDGRLRAVRTLNAASGAPGPARLHGMLAREALLLNLPLPARLQWTTAAADNAGTTSPTLHCETFAQTSAISHPAADEGAAPARTAGLALARKETRA